MIYFNHNTRIYGLNPLFIMGGNNIIMGGGKEKQKNCNSQPRTASHQHCQA